jgi:hypothetical protein
MQQFRPVRLLLQEDIGISTKVLLEKLLATNQNWQDLGKLQYPLHKLLLKDDLSNGESVHCPSMEGKEQFR